LFFTPKKGTPYTNCIFVYIFGGTEMPISSKYKCHVWHYNCAK